MSGHIEQGKPRLAIPHEVHGFVAEGGEGGEPTDSHQKDLGHYRYNFTIKERITDRIMMIPIPLKMS